MDIKETKHALLEVIRHPRAIPRGGKILLLLDLSCVTQKDLPKAEMLPNFT